MVWRTDKPTVAMLITLVTLVTLPVTSPAQPFVPSASVLEVRTSGPVLPWADYVGGQRKAIIGAALFEGLAKNEAQAEARLAAGEIKVDGCHAHGCVGSLAGVYSASMPVFVVRNGAFGNRTLLSQ